MSKNHKVHLVWVHLVLPYYKASIFELPPAVNLEFTDMETDMMTSHATVRWITSSQLLNKQTTTKKKTEALTGDIMSFLLFFLFQFEGKMNQKKLGCRLDSRI